jgi:hypothetical protein
LQWPYAYPRHKICARRVCGCSLRARQGGSWAIPWPSHDRGAIEGTSSMQGLFLLPRGTARITVERNSSIIEI